jgi:hypothetical protein
MRLIHSTALVIEEFFDDNIPEYAILSHTWGAEEVSIQEMQSGIATAKAGYAKIQLAAQQAAIHGLHWVWVDTCCIDKTSSAELSEAINSMYRWYERAKVCYAYLPDVYGEIRLEVSDFGVSKWFTRGWTLQELIAPTALVFYGVDWRYLGEISVPEHRGVVAKITGVDARFLGGIGRDVVHTATVARRMSWASNRKTSRIEDLAYCLMGIFDVNIPLLYGEGDKAFVRLQQEIIKDSDDQTIFAWFDEAQESHTEYCPGHGLLAPSPKLFANSGDFSRASLGYPPYSFTNKGLCLRLLMENRGDASSISPQYFALLECMSGHKHIAVEMQNSHFKDKLSRKTCRKLEFLDYERFRGVSSIIYVQQRDYTRREVLNLAQRLLGNR